MKNKFISNKEFIKMVKKDPKGWSIGPSIVGVPKTYYTSDSLDLYPDPKEEHLPISENEE